MTERKARARGKAVPPPQDEPIVTPDDLRNLGTMNIRVLSFHRKVVGSQSVGYVGVPRDMIGEDGHTAIIWRSATESHHDFDGWEPWYAGWCGVHKKTLASALHWIQRARDVWAGKAKDFRGC